jgi:hypothetical protein
MVGKGKQEIAERTLIKYEDQLGRAFQKAEELKSKSAEKANEVKTRIEESTLKHLQMLQENLAKVPEAAKVGVETEFASKPRHGQVVYFEIGRPLSTSFSDGIIKTQISIDGVSAVKITTPNPDGVLVRQIIFDKNDYQFKFFSSAQSTNTSETIDQILSTFKFIEPSSGN